MNPGSATGAFVTGASLDAEPVSPSFCLMDVRGTCHVSRDCLLFVVLTIITGSGHFAHSLCIPIEDG